MTMKLENIVRKMKIPFIVISIGAGIASTYAIDRHTSAPLDHEQESCIQAIKEKHMANKAYRDGRIDSEAYFKTVEKVELECYRDETP